MTSRRCSIVSGDHRRSVRTVAKLEYACDFSLAPDGHDHRGPDSLAAQALTIHLARYILHAA